MALVLLDTAACNNITEISIQGIGDLRFDAMKKTMMK
jgi:hypothetical protein